MAATEILKLIVNADTKGAVTQVQQFGTAAEKSFGKAKTSIDQVAAGMTKWGAVAVGVGAAVLFGLGKAASAAEEANLATLKLQNSLTNNPMIAGDSIKAFEDQATALSKVTVASDDAIKSGMAMLATFRVTGEQVQELTPLVLDYSRKFGVDLVSANAAVGKALDGSIGALKRQGVTIDETMFKTDRYGAVMSALRSQVGGFAEAEGKTFAGQVQILKNQLGELAEGVGVGAVQAFTKMFGAVEKVVGAFDKLSPGAQSAIGEFTTYAATALVVGGATSMLIGKLITLRNGLVAVGVATKVLSIDLAAETVGVTALGAAIGAVAIPALIALGGAYYGTQHQRSVFVDGQAAEAATTEQLTEVYHRFGSGILDSAMQQKFFSEMADQSLASVIRLRDALKAAGEDTSMLDAIITKETAAQGGANAAADDGAEAFAGLDKEVKDVKKSFDELYDAVTGGEEASLAYNDAVRGVQSALEDVRTTVDDATTAVNEHDEAVDNAKGDIIDMGLKAQAAYKQAGASSADAATAQIAALQSVVAELEPGSPLLQWLNAYIYKLASVPRAINTHFTGSGTWSGVSNIGRPSSVPGIINWAAKGYDGWVSAKPGGSMFNVGEGGEDEYVSITPRSKMGGTSGGSGGGVTEVHTHLYLDGQHIIESISRHERSNGSAWRNN